MIQWCEIRAFLNRPRGGIESETLFAIAELWFGASLVYSTTGIGLDSVTGLQELRGHVTSPVVGMPWLIAGLLTCLGLYLFRRGKWVCAPIRWVGALLSCWLWAWLALTTVLVVEGRIWQAPYLGLYIVAAVSGVRAMFSAWQRWRLH